METIFDKFTNIANAIRSKTKKTNSLTLDDMATEIYNIPSLNFSIIGGTEQPSDPTENTIWVNTNIEITDYLITATEPNVPTEGMIWIPTGTSSKMEIDVVIHNTLIIYPLSVLQYIANKWVRKDTMIYKNNNWVEYNNPIYWVTDGIVNEEIGLYTGSDSTYFRPGTLYNGSYTIHVSDAYITGGPSARSLNLINLTYYRTIKLICQDQRNGTVILSVGDKSVSKSSNGAGELILNVADVQGNQYIEIDFLGNSTGDNSLYIKSIIIL